MATDTPRIPEQGVATLPDEAWERARRRAEIISPLAQSETVGHEAADMAAQGGYELPKTVLRLSIFCEHTQRQIWHLTLELSRAAKRRRLERIVRHYLPTTLVISPFT